MPENDPFKNPYGSPSSGSSVPAGQAPQTIRQSARINQMISLSLAMGLTIISAVFLFMVVPKADRVADLFALSEDSLLLLGLGFGVSFVSALVSVVMRIQTKQVAAREFLASDLQVSLPVPFDEAFPGSEKLLAGFATSNLIGAALLEGPGIINAIFILTNHNLWHLVAVGLAVIGILLTVPTTTKIKYFVEDVVSRSR